MSRNDITDFLIHFTRGDCPENAFKCLQKIIAEQTLLGRNRLIKGGYNCVCFSEAPLVSLDSGLVNPAYYSQYSRFGIMVHKQWLFELGGRPVIYQPDSEFDALPETHRWRHVRYEPPAVDFSWEREWRIQCTSLQFDRDVASVVVPDRSWAEVLVKEDQDSQLFHYKTLLRFDDILADLHFEPFRWRIFMLS